MCGRYVMARAVGDLLAEFDAELEKEVALEKSWNVAPTDTVPIVLERVVEESVKRQLHVAKWGLVPSWAKDAKGGARLINARSETLLEKPSFRKAAVARRCAVPADGYYEWKKGEGKNKQPYYVHPGNGGGVVFAGLYEWWRDQSLPEDDPARWLLSMSIITADTPTAESARTRRSASVFDELTALHDRVPLPMSKDTMEAWLDPKEKDAEELVRMVRSRAHDAAADWTLDAVGAAVGNVRNNSPELIEPVQALF
ncbi:MAG: SOS response-associated peptidase [Paenarthrobacter ureafaciens]|nr:SOS response-associated peptidase [Paenarthrobacter ureafaciens]MBN9129470.1 SOS response-associated peptidase [Paenarthrobacter ureafaciens]QOT16941.1 SOS response-associated peptidase [Paenarthrobacter sp. YJN-5]